MAAAPPFAGLGNALNDLLGLGSSGIYAYYMQQLMNEAQNTYNMQNQAAQIGMNPQQMQKQIEAYQEPLSNDLVTEVQNYANPKLQEAGLGTSPASAESIYAQALAPDVMNEQGLAASEALSGMGIPFNVGSGLAGTIPSLTTGGLSGGGSAATSSGTGGIGGDLADLLNYANSIFS